MQLKFNRNQSVKEIMIKKLAKILVACFFLITIIFLMDKINFPSPETSIKKEITDEIIKLK
jgi:formate hydrogenlyase subunit 4|tara:strand:+ start:52 stop:234 length:183 start_codon:yes stop_codon:yes gene_type:complete